MIVRRPGAGARPIATRRGADLAHVGVAVGEGGGVDAEEDEVGARHRLGVVGGEAQAAGGQVAGDQLLQPRLVDRDLAPVQRRDLVGRQVEPDDVVAQVGQAAA